MGYVATEHHAAKANGGCLLIAGAHLYQKKAPACI